MHDRWFVAVAKKLDKSISNSRQIHFKIETNTIQNWSPSSTWSGDLWLCLKGVAAYEGRGLHVGRDPCGANIASWSTRPGVDLYPYTHIPIKSSQVICLSPTIFKLNFYICLALKVLFTGICITMYRFGPSKVIEPPEKSAL